MMRSNSAWIIGCLVLGTGTAFLSTELSAEGQMSGRGKACTTISKLGYNACQFDVKDDVREGAAACLNVMDSSDRRECIKKVFTERRENQENCNEVRKARVALCGRLGQARYDVTDYWKPDNFVNPLEIGRSVAANNYFDLTSGRTWMLETDEESVTVTVTSATKNIGGVDCVVVNDIAVEEGVVVEDTDDWFAQDIEGNVWYCGEISQNFELFEGDNPPEPELVDVEGSWKAFEDNSQPGIVMQANPRVGQIYRQEYAFGDAEDIAEVISTNADALLRGDRCEADIAAQIDRLCNADCLVTRETTPLEPEALEHKYYQPGGGIILELDKAEGGCVPVSN